jgi:hypothetical protein
VTRTVTLGYSQNCGVVDVVSPVDGVAGQAFGRAVTPVLGAGGGGSGTAPSDCVAKFLMYWRDRVKDMSEPRYTRFYLVQSTFHPPVSQYKVAEVCGNGADIRTAVKELEAIERLLAYEYDSAYTYLMFLEYIINAPWDVFEGDEKKFREDVGTLKRLLAIYEKEYEERKVEEVTTKSGRKLYLKVKDGKVVVSGDTYPVKDALKHLGFKWDPLERVWYAPATSGINAVKTRLEVL